MSITAVPAVETLEASVTPPTLPLPLFHSVVPHLARATVTALPDSRGPAFTIFPLPRGPESFLRCLPVHPSCPLHPAPISCAFLFARELQPCPLLPYDPEQIT